MSKADGFTVFRRTFQLDAFWRVGPCAHSFHQWRDIVLSYMRLDQGLPPATRVCKNTQEGMGHSKIWALKEPTTANIH